MHFRPAVLFFLMLTGVSTLLGKKDAEPKEYTNGTIVEVALERPIAGVVSHNASYERKTVYVIDCKEGRYEVREYQSARLFRPLDVAPGDPVTFRLHPKGRILYVSLDRGERPLEVVKFVPASGKVD